MDNQQLKKVKLSIRGMRCSSCEVLIEQKLKKIAGIEKVRVNHAAGRAELFCSKNPNIGELNDLVRSDGYNISLWQDGNSTAPRATEYKNTAEDYWQMGWIFFVIVSLYYISKQFNFLPDLAISERMSYGFIFLIGLFAAVSSCIAVVGGLLLAVAGKHNELHPDLTGIQKFKPHIYFNAGRIAGYTIFGAAIGALGSTLTLSAKTNGYLIIIVGAVMLLLGFQLLHLFPGLRRFSPKMPKFISRKAYDLSTKENKSAPFALGASTFFLPCGFTQALQLYVLAGGDWKTGALTMLTFSLGTLPALLSLSAVSSFAKGSFQKSFLRFAGVLIAMLALFNINNGLTLAGYRYNIASAFSAIVIGSKDNGQSKNAPAVEIIDGRQIVKMTVRGYTYIPNRFTIVEGVPVEWQIDGREAAGCGRVIVMPSLGINKYLPPQGITTITFTPEKTGNIAFNCSMGMMTPGSGFTVVQNTAGIVGAKIESETIASLPACNPDIQNCPEAQKIFMEVSQEKGIYPRSLTAKKGSPIELIIDDKIPLGGCASVWVIPKFNITIAMDGGGVKKNTFTPIESGPLYITCSMGSKIAEIIIKD